MQHCTKALYSASEMEQTIICGDTTIQSSEDALIHQAVQGDLESFNQLVLNYQTLLYDHALALLGDYASAEDVTQEGFIKAFQNIGRFRGGSFRAWLLKIVRNTARDLQRYEARRATVPLLPESEEGSRNESPVWLVDPAQSVQDQVDQNELFARIHRNLNELPASFCSVLTLVDLNKLDYLEAAEVLGVPIGTVKSRLARARLQMKEMLQEDHAGAGRIGSTVADSDA